MEYPQRLTTLQTLQAEILLQLEKEMAAGAKKERIDEYHQILKQIDAEVSRIQKMRSYKPNLTR